MLFEIKIATESFGADLTGEWLLVVVGVHVEGEIIDLMEGFIADRALICFIAAVCQFVILIVALLMETLPTKFTHERLIPCMDSGMGVEGGGAIEGLTARVTFMGLLRCVNDFMTTECRCLTR